MHLGQKRAPHQEALVSLCAVSGDVTCATSPLSHVTVNLGPSSDDLSYKTFPLHPRQARSGSTCRLAPWAQWVYVSFICHFVIVGDTGCLRGPPSGPPPEDLMLYHLLCEAPSVPGGPVPTRRTHPGPQAPLEGRHAISRWSGCLQGVCLREDGL